VTAPEPAQSATLFCRVSSAKQAQRYSPEAQQRLGEEYAARKGLAITRVFQVVETASKKARREKWREYLSYVRRGPEGHALVATVDRALRNFADLPEVAELQKKYGKTVHFFLEGLILDGTHASTTDLRLGISAAVAVWYAGELAEKTRRGTDQKALKGEFPNRAPWGYLNDKATKRIVVDPAAARWVRRIKQLAAARQYTLDQMLAIVRSEGCRVHGRPIYRNMIERVVRNPLYAGRYDWPTGSGNWVQGTHEAIVPWAVHEAGLAWLQRKNRPRYRKHLFTMAGMIRCGCCPEGRAVIFEMRKGRFIYAHCTGYQLSKFKNPDGTRSRLCPDAVFVPAALIDAQVEAALERIQISEEMVTFIARELARDAAAAQAQSETQVAILKGLLTKLQARIDQAYADKLDGKIDEAFWAAQQKRMGDEKVRLEEELRRQEEAGPSTYMPNVKRVLKLAKDIVAIYKSAPVEKKRRLLDLAYSNWRLVGKKIEYQMKTPFAELAEGRASGNWLGVCGVIQNWATAVPLVVV
jgi:site-specific DNA recombinase